MIEQVERFFRLKHQIELLRQRRPRVKELHLLSGKPSDPHAATREKAFLMQLRLHLQAQLDSEPSG